MTGSLWRPSGVPLRRLLLLAAGVCLIVYLALVVKAVLWPVRGELRDFPLPGQGEPLLVIAPHEDDETLGCGITIRDAVARGVPVWVCLLTCGEGEELGTAWVAKRPRPSAAQFVRLGQIRQRESLRALASVGVPQDHVIFLGYPNMGLRWMWSARYWSPDSLWTSPFTKTDHSPFDNSLTPQAPFCGASALRDVEAVIARVRPRYLLATHPADTHPDHWATYCFTRLALEELRARSAERWPRECRLLTYLVHRRGWPAPWGYYPELRLSPPRALADLPVNEWYSRSLTRDETRAKNRMILTYRSQAAAFDLLLRAFARRNELFATINDDPQGFLPSWLQADTSLEPSGETEYLRRHRDTDIVGVEVSPAGEVPSVAVHTAAPLAHAQLEVSLTRATPGQVRCAMVQFAPGSAPRAWTATDGDGPRVADAEVRIETSGTTTTVFVPAAWVGPGRLMVDVMTVSRNRPLDRAITRTAGDTSSAAEQPPARVLGRNSRE